MSITKRFFSFGTLAAAVLTAGLLLGCGAPAAEQPPSSSPTGSSDPGQPKHGGTLSFFGRVLGYLDAHRSANIYQIESFGNIHGYLLELDTQDRKTIHGDLAESWEMSKDGMGYTFKIRQGLKTHKGKDFNAEDIVYNIQRMIDRPNKMPVPRAGCIRAAVKDVSAPDQYTVVINLKDPVASFTQCLTNPYLFMQPKYVLEAIDVAGQGRPMQFEDVDGVGPFQLDEWVSDSLFKVKRFDGFYKQGLPYLDAVQMVDLPDSATQIAAFRTQRIDQFGAFATTPTPSEAAALKREFGDRVTVAEVEAPGFRGFMVNYKKPPFDDIRVREAIDLAVDRENQKELVLEGKGSLSGPYFGGWDRIYSFEEMSKWPGYRKDKTQDLARAKQLLKDAGFENGLTIGHVLCGTGDNDDCTVLAEDLKKVGITARLNRVESLAKQEQGEKGEFDLFYDSKGAEYDDPDVFNALIYLPTAGLNLSRWQDSEFMRLYEQERVEQDQKKRGEALRKMADVVRDSHVFILTNRALLEQTWWSYVKGYVPPKDFYQTSMRRDQIWLDK